MSQYAYDLFTKLERVVEFQICDEHLNLLRCAYVSWSATEFGAPEINPKRPYGTSSVVDSIAEIVEPDYIDWDLDTRERYAEDHEEMLIRLHVETAIALQICLTLGTFETGTYRRSSLYDTKWAKVSG